jgi:hypothetical protein
MRSKKGLGSLVLMAAGVVSMTAHAAMVSVYSDRAAFAGTLGSSVLDDYSAPAYALGDLGAGALAIHTDAHISAVLGETKYRATGPSNADANIISSARAFPSSPFYCAGGCDSSFLLDFTSTSVGTAAGVFGAGFDFFHFDLPRTPYHAFLTFGDGSSFDLLLPVAPLENPGFIGFTTSESIASIAIGAANGEPSEAGVFGMDNLLIGSAAAVTVPEPSTIALLLGALAIFRVTQKKGRAPLS